MKDYIWSFKICGFTDDGFEDSLYVGGDTIEEIREKAKEEVSKRGWTTWWSEKIAGE